MINVLAPFSPTKLFALPTGGLAYVARPRGRALVLVLRAKEDSSRGVLLAVLTPAGFGVTTPCYVSMERDLDCLLVPATWVIELIDEESAWPKNRALVDAAGVLHLDSDGLHLNLDNHPDNSMQSEVTFNLQTMDYSDVSQSATPYARWRIWSAAEDRKLGNAKPLFEFAGPNSA